MELQAHLSLADHATAVGGKLYVNGGNWNLRPPGPMPWALTLEVKVPWHDNNRSFPFRLDLLDADGRPFEVDTPQGKRALFVGGEMRATAGPGLKPGSQIVGLAAIVLPPIALPASEQFEWKLSIDDATRDEWRVAFATSE
jgi:hypothetical protein